MLLDDSGSASVSITILCSFYFVPTRSSQQSAVSRGRHISIHYIHPSSACHAGDDFCRILTFFNANAPSLDPCTLPSGNPGQSPWPSTSTKAPKPKSARPARTTTPSTPALQHSSNLNPAGGPYCTRTECIVLTVQYKVTSTYLRSTACDFRPLITTTSITTTTTTTHTTTTAFLPRRDPPLAHW
ncbi:hypothetical protein ACMFMG_011092 [Clarireedia jacksonii]